MTDTEVWVPMHSYDGALSFIFNVKSVYPHLRLMYAIGTGVTVTDFKSESEVTLFRLTCDNFRGIYA